MTDEDRKMEDDDAFDRELAAMLAPPQADTAELSRAVLSRIAEQSGPARPPLAEVLTTPAPLGLGFAAALLSVAALGYAIVPVADDPLALLMLIGGF